MCLKWYLVCPSVYLKPMHEGETKRISSACLTFIQMWGGVKWKVVCPSVCPTKISIWGMKWNVVCPYVCRTKIPIWGVKWNIVCPTVFLTLTIIWGGTIKRSYSVCLTWIQILGINITLFVRLSALTPDMRGEMKVSLSVRLSYLSQNEEWNETLFVRISILCGFQYEGWKKLIRLFYFDPNMRVKRNVVVRLSKTTIWGKKWNIVCPSVWCRFKYEGWNETYFVRLFVLRRFLYQGWKET